MRNFIIYLIFIGIIYLIIGMFSIIGSLDRIEVKLKERQVRDSLYIEHLIKCSMISKDQLEVGYDNYLRVIDSNDLIWK